MEDRPTLFRPRQRTQSCTSTSHKQDLLTVKVCEQKKEGVLSNHGEMSSVAFLKKVGV